MNYPPVCFHGQFVSVLCFVKCYCLAEPLPGLHAEDSFEMFCGNFSLFPLWRRDIVFFGEVECYNTSPEVGDPLRGRFSLRVLYLELICVCLSQCCFPRRGL